MPASLIVRLKFNPSASWYCPNWYDGGQKPDLPDELKDDETLVIQVAEVFFNGTKGI